MKGKRHSHMLAPMGKPLSALLEFLAAVNLGVAPQLRMMHLKVKFWVTATQSFGCSAQGFKAIVDAGLVEVLTEAMEGDGSTLELWLRTMVHDVWVGYLKAATTPDELHGKLETLSEDANDGCGVLRLKGQSEVNTRVVAPVLADLQMLSVLTLAWKPERVLAADVSSALARLATKRLQSISDTLLKCDLGGEMLASSALVIQRSSQTAAADASFRAGGDLALKRPHAVHQDRWRCACPGESPYGRRRVSI